MTAVARPRVQPAEVDARALAVDLQRRIEGEVRFGSESRALYATDASNFRHVPIGVVLPRTIDDVVETVAACREHGAPVLPRGCGTSLSGETVNVAVVIDCSKYLREILEIDTDRRLARVQPGVVLDQLRDETRQLGLTFGPDPSTHAYCTLGGMIGNNSCGVHSVMAAFAGDGGRMSDNVAELEILTYDGARFRVGPTSDAELERIVEAGGRRGEIYGALGDLRDRYGDLVRERFPDIPRRVSGYNLDDLLPERGFDVAAALAGTEGTCAVVLEATVKLIPEPAHRALVATCYRDVFEATEHVPEIMEFEPIGLEGIDCRLIQDEERAGLHTKELELLPGVDQGAWLFVELGCDSEAELEERVGALLDRLGRDGLRPERMKAFFDPDQQKALWAVREAGLAATALPEKEDRRPSWPGWEDSAVPPERLSEYLRDLRGLFDRYGYDAAFYGHFGQGCVHTRIPFDLFTADGVAAYRSFMEEAADLVVSYGGSLSGEHGDGQQRAELLPRMYGEELVEAFREFKEIWDPEWKLNPGKVVDPRPLDADLRLGPDYHPWRPETRFAFPDDAGDFTHSALRCVGVGQCRVTGGEQVMCPSYMVLREEKHTTRGRARLLHEMLLGEVVTDGWRSEEVFEALDLCLACKGCTADCPVNVDIPTYKAEFLSHYYDGRRRPRTAYAFGLIDRAARVASLAPGLADLVARTRLAKFAAGMAQERSAPRFAPMTLRDWFARRGERNVGSEKVILWADTFNDHFHTHVGVAAVEELEAAGYHVTLPPKGLCCGRPLYDFGMLDRAKRYLLDVLDALRDDLRAGVRVVGIEPSCLAVFRDELRSLLPRDEDAARLVAQAVHFGELLGQTEGWEPPALARKAIFQGHCHQRATGGIEPDVQVLERMGVEVELPESGCCGLAGSFGFAAEHYDVSMAIGERVLLPAVREAPDDWLVVANGFSCKTQIEQGGTERRGLHLAEVLRLAREHGPEGPPGRPEDWTLARPPRTRRSRWPLVAVAAGAGATMLAARRWR